MRRTKSACGEADLAGLLRFGGRFVRASGDYGGHAQWAAYVGDAQNQRSAVTATNRELYASATHDEDARGDCASANRTAPVG